MTRLKDAFRPSSAFLFLAPSMIFVLLFYFVPILLTILISFTGIDQTYEWKFIGLENFRRLLGGGDTLIPKIIRNTVIYVAGGLPLTIGIALLVSILSIRMNQAVALGFRTVFFLPRTIPPVVWGFLWAWGFEGTKYGIFNSILAGLGLTPVHWLIRYPMIIIILANSFLGVALAMLVFTSAIKSIPVDYIRAAEVDGASFWQLSMYLIIPCLKWPIFTMSIWHLMSFLNSYVYILLITQGGPYYATEVWSLYGYHLAFQNYQFGYGSSLMMLLILVNAVIFILVWKLFGMGRMLRPSGVEI